MASPRFEENYYKGRKYSDVVKTDYQSLTTAGTTTTWTPATGKKILLKGIRVVATVTTVIDAAGAVALIAFFDQSVDQEIPLGIGFASNKAIGSTFTADIDFAEGLASDVDAILKVKPHISIGSGTMDVHIYARGEEI